MKKLLAMILLTMLMIISLASCEQILNSAPAGTAKIDVTINDDGYNECNFFQFRWVVSHTI